MLPTSRLKEGKLSKDEEAAAAVWMLRFNETYIVAKAYLDKEIAATKADVITIALAYMDRTSKGDPVHQDLKKKVELPKKETSSTTSDKKPTEPVKDDAPVAYERCGLMEFKELSGSQAVKARGMMKTIKDGFDVEEHLLEKLEDKGLDNKSYAILKEMCKHFGVKKMFQSLKPIPKPLLDEFMVIMFGCDLLYRWDR